MMTILQDVLQKVLLNYIMFIKNLKYIMPSVDWGHEGDRNLEDDK